MEASLKSACSAFITCAVELVASPLLSWLSKVMVMVMVMKEQTADYSLAHANVRFHFALFILCACVRSLVFLDLEADLTGPFVEARLFPSHRLEPQKIAQLCGALLPSPWLVFELEPPLTIVLTQLPATELYALVCMYVSMYFYVCRVGNDTKRNAGASFRRPRGWRRAREPARAAVCKPRARQGVCASCLCLVNGTAALVLCAG